MPEVKFNSDELVPPSFVTEQFVLEILKSAEKDPELSLIKYEIVPGSSAGDHYASIMFKVIATYESKGLTLTDKRFLLKTVPESGDKKDFLDDFPVFSNEIRMYTETLPAMEEILNQHGDKRFWPKMVYSIPTPPVLVFEDLTQDKFGMHYDPLPLKDLQFIIERIAKYHALSMVIAESDKSELVSGFSSGFEAEKLRPMFQSTIKEYTKLGEIVEQWPGMEEIGAKIQKSPEKIFENFAKSYTKRNTWGFNVLNHGDFHIRNMMFKKNGQGSIEDVTFLDYQVPMYHSPAFDLVYMFNLIGGREVRDRKFEVVNSYHKELRKNLTKYGFTGEIPSVIDIHVELFNLVGFETFHTIGLMPVFRVDLTGVELGELFNKTEENPITIALRRLYNDPEFVDEMKMILVRLDSLDAFD